MRIFGKRVLAVLFGGLLFLFSISGYCQQTNADFELGKQRYDQSDWTGAIANFSKSIEAAFNLYDSYSYRAYSKAMLGDSNGANVDCNQVIKLAANPADGYFWRSRVEFELTNHTDALRDFDAGLKLNPQAKPADLAYRVAIYYQNMGFKKLHKDDADGAMACLERGIYICPTNWWIYNWRGYVKLVCGKYGGAMADVDVLLKHHPEDVRGHEIRAWARYELQDVSGAAEDCAAALDTYAKKQAEAVGRHPDDTSWEVQSLSVKGLRSYINGDFQSAIDQWNGWLKGAEVTVDPFTQAYYEKWIERAQSKLQEIPAGPSTNSLSPANAR